MDIKISYSQIQLDKAVEFVHKNNSYLVDVNEIRSDILSSMRELAVDRSATFYGTMGVILIPECTEEDLDQDDYTCHIEIYVNPSLGIYPEDEDEDFKEATITVAAEKYWKENGSD
jgi:hypothetical protein